MQCKIKVSGKVQGVFFRSFIRDICLELGLTGRVSNCSDGSVEIKVIGERKKIDMLVSKCYSGSAGAQVENVEVSEEEVGKFSEFKIDY